MSCFLLFSPHIISYHIIPEEGSFVKFWLRRLRFVWRYPPVSWYFLISGCFVRSLSFAYCAMLYEAMPSPGQSSSSLSSSSSAALEQILQLVLFACVLRDWGIDQDEIANTDFSQLIHKSWERNKRCPVKHLNPITFYRTLLQSNYNSSSSQEL